MKKVGWQVPAAIVGVSPTAYLNYNRKLIINKRCWRGHQHQPEALLITLFLLNFSRSKNSFYKSNLIFASKISFYFVDKGWQLVKRLLAIDYPEISFIIIRGYPVNQYLICSKNPGKKPACRLCQILFQ